jgi:CDGSH-type Zn-finger protein
VTADSFTINIAVRDPGYFGAYSESRDRAGVLLSCASAHHAWLHKYRLDGRTTNRTRATIQTMATKVTPLHDGPLRIEGEFEIYDAAGQMFGLAGRTVISLCRCGQSANKPFCDGSHKRVGFSDACTAHELPPPKPKL